MVHPNLTAGHIAFNVGATTVSTNHSSYLTQVATSNSYNGGVNGIRYGRLSNSTVTHRRAGEPAITKSSSFTYYTSGVATNLLQTETIDAGSDGAQAVTTNRYAYVHNNPLSATDPSGYGANSGVWGAIKIA